MPGAFLEKACIGPVVARSTDYHGDASRHGQHDRVAAAIGREPRREGLAYGHLYVRRLCTEPSSAIRAKRPARLS